MSQEIEAYRLLPGMLLARKYRLNHRIGHGAMGVVWAATNEVTGREVALKLIARPDPSLRHRLLREAQACGALQHPNIVDVIDVVRTEGGEPCLIMELLVGDSVAALLEARRRLDAPLAVRIAHDVASALAAAHAVQIVHRDLKPANIFVHRPAEANDIVIKVLDFGVAKNLAVARGVTSTLDAAVGSPFYMSPEQVRADGDIDPRADLWALGVVLFEMLTGVRPFQGEGPQLLSQILSGEIPKVSRYLRRVDERLVRIVDRCLRRDRDERFGTAEEVVRELSEVVLPGAGARAAGLPSEVSAAAAEAGWRESPARTAGEEERARPLSPLSRTAAEQETVMAPARGQGREASPEELATTVPLGPPGRGEAQAARPAVPSGSPAGGGLAAPVAKAEPLVTARGTFVMRGQAAAAHQQAAARAHAQAQARRAEADRARAQAAADVKAGGKAGRRGGTIKAVAATLAVSLLVGVLAAEWLIGWRKASDAPAGVDGGGELAKGAMEATLPEVERSAATGASAGTGTSAGTAAPADVASPEHPAELRTPTQAVGAEEAGRSGVTADTAGGKGITEIVKTGRGQPEQPSQAAGTTATATAGGRTPPPGSMVSQQNQQKAPLAATTSGHDEVYEEIHTPAPKKKLSAPPRPFD